MAIDLVAVLNFAVKEEASDVHIKAGLPPILRIPGALRQDPDVIMVGEMRDMETIEIALTAAETGHLVLSTLHTIDSMETVNRIVYVFPPYQQKQIRIQLV